MNLRCESRPSGPAKYIRLTLRIGNRISIIVFEKGLELIAHEAAIP